MKKKLLLSISIITAVALFKPQIQLHGFSSAAPNGHSGSPSDGKTCATSSCHSGGAVNNRDGIITSNIPTEGYLAGSTYTITVTLAESGVSRFGFLLTAENAQGIKTGGFQNGTGAQTLDNQKSVTHTQASTNASNQQTWTFDWTAPAAGTGNVTFYGAFNLANNNGMASGDVILTSSLSVAENNVLGLASETTHNNLSLNLNNSLLQLNSTRSGIFKYEVYNISGQILMAGITADNTLDISNLSKGVLIVSLAQNENKIIQKVAHL